jgi:hypothetical protein
MAKRQRTPQDLEELLAEQIQFLEASATAFDQGFEGEAKRLAVTARVLLHDTDRSHALLDQINKKPALFWDTALPNEAGNQTPHGGLVFAAIGGNESKYVAMLDDVPQNRKIPFDEWWNAKVFSDDRRETLSRRDLVLIAANQDGGAHVDPTLDEIYARLSKDNSMGGFVVDADGPKPLLGPERAAIRQVAHELLKTLQPGYLKKVERDAQMFIGGVVTKSELDAESMIEKMQTQHVVMSTGKRSVKVGRNEKCPCGSGIKYKKCHGAY